VAEGRAALSRAQKVAIVEKVCSAVLTDRSYFGTIRRSPGFHRALSRTIDEIRSSGVRPAAIGRSPLEDPRKAADLAAILEAYERELGGLWIDEPGLLRRAIAACGPGALREGARILLPERPRLLPLEEELVRRLAGDRLTILAVDDQARPFGAGQTIRFRRAVGEENEIRDVFRRALADRIPCDQIEILYTDRSTYLSLAYELTRRYEIPSTFVDRIDAAYTRPGRAALGFLDWLSADFGERALRALLAAGALDVRKLSGSETLSGAAAARILQAAKIGRGSARYASCLEGLAARQPGGRHGGEESPERRARRRQDVAAVGRLVGKLVSFAPVESSVDAVSLKALASSCGEVVREFARSASELDGVAAEAIPALLEDVGFLGDAPMPLRDAAARLREAVAELHVGGSSVTYPQPGKIHVASVADGGYTGRPYTFVVGLDESRHPGAGLQDPVLLDSERRRLNAAGAATELALRGDAPRERDEALRSTLARLRGEVVFSWSCHDLGEDREQFPSAFVLEAFREARGVPDADAAALSSEAGAPAGYFAETAPLDLSEWWLTALRDVGVPSSGRSAVAAAFPGIASGDEAEAARRSAAFTRWDGAVAAGAALDPRETGKPVSASRLELLARCPFAYFLRYVLRVEPPDEAFRDDGTWLTPGERGALVHEVLREYMQEQSERRGKVSADRSRARLFEIADAAVYRWKNAIPPPTEGHLERERAAVRRIGATFLSAEERAGDRATPYRFELAFGEDGSAPDADLGNTAIVRIPLSEGKAIRVRGSIDRVDRASDGSFEIWDYKTGSAWGFDAERGIDGGRRIQHALYAAAFEELLRNAGRPASVTRSGYFFVGPRGNGRREDFGWERSRFVAAVDALCDVIHAGAFLHAAKEDGCSFCPYESVCGGRRDASESALRKLERGDGALSTLLRLGDVE